MYQTKQIHYKSIFKQDGQTETIEYKAKGIVHKGQKTEIVFDVDHMSIHITYDENGIILSQGTSTLRFDYQREVWNQYQLPYGQVALKTKLMKFEVNEECLKMKYELYDHSGLISTVYILITMVPYSLIEA